MWLTRATARCGCAPLPAHNPLCTPLLFHLQAFLFVNFFSLHLQAFFPLNVFFFLSSFPPVFADVCGSLAPQPVAAAPRSPPTIPSARRCSSTYKRSLLSFFCLFSACFVCRVWLTRAIAHRGCGPLPAHHPSARSCSSTCKHCFLLVLISPLFFKQ